MNYVTIIQLILTAAYLYHIKVIPSISDSYRTIKDKRVYHAFFLLSAVLVACQGIYAERMGIPYVIAGFFFYAISLAASFWVKGEGWLHVFCTYATISVGLTLTVVRIWPKWGFYALALVAAMLLVALLGPLVVRKNTTYWQEVFSYLVIFGPIIKL